MINNPQVPGVPFGGEVESAEQFTREQTADANVKLPSVWHVRVNDPEDKKNPLLHVSEQDDG